MLFLIITKNRSFFLLSFIKIADLENVNDEIDTIVNKCHTLYGQITSIEKNNNNYICQGCGGTDLTDETTFISCNNCHSRLLKDID